MKKFYSWILLFFLFLSLIPLLIICGYYLTAKVIGVLTIITLSFALRFWMYKTKKQFQPVERVKINFNDRFWLKKHVSFYNNLPNPDKIVFEDRLGIFLSRVPVVFLSNKLAVSKEDAMLIASSAVIGLWSNVDFKGSLCSYVLINDTAKESDLVFLKDNFVEIPLEILKTKSLFMLNTWV